MNIIESIQSKLKEENISAYVVLTSDYHQSEYISDYFKIRAYISGFTGSAGDLVITADDARLWTDGRYYLQAERELEDSGITLMRTGEAKVKTIFNYLSQYVKKDSTILFDGKMVSINFILKLEKELGYRPKYLTTDIIVNSIWPNRPQLPTDKIYHLDEFFVGKSFLEKRELVLKELANKKCDTLILTALEDEAWLYNIRGNDVSYTPVFLSYTVLTQKETILYLNQDKITKDLKPYFKDNDIIIKDYDEIYKDLTKFKGNTILLDPNKVNYEIYNLLKDNNKIVLAQNPTLNLKCIKNETEIENTILAHIKDGVAVTELMYYLKHLDFKEEITELKISHHLLNLRKQQKGFIEPSFETICAYGANGAMLHYTANLETDTRIEKDNLLLIDSGGHYLEGTTDITRTFAIGNISAYQKELFTTVLKSVIALSKAVFLEGCRGQNLDILARGPLWEKKLDYRCGTGHGVGHVLSVHEGPNGFRWNIVPERQDSAILREGMITTNEPGVYLDNEFGIRIENEMLCVSAGSSEYGNFLKFKTITYAPIDLDCIDINLLTKEEKDWLNDYHEMVHNTLKEYMSGDMLAWLAFATRKI